MFSFTHSLAAVASKKEQSPEIELGPLPANLAYCLLGIYRGGRRNATGGALAHGGQGSDQQLRPVTPGPFAQFSFPHTPMAVIGQ